MPAQGPKRPQKAVKLPSPPQKEDTWDAFGPSSDASVHQEGGEWAAFGSEQEGPPKIAPPPPKRASPHAPANPPPKPLPPAPPAATNTAPRGDARGTVRPPPSATSTVRG